MILNTSVQRTFGRFAYKSSCYVSIQLTGSALSMCLYRSWIENKVRRQRQLWEKIAWREAAQPISQCCSLSDSLLNIGSSGLISGALWEVDDRCWLAFPPFSSRSSSPYKRFSIYEFSTAPLRLVSLSALWLSVSCSNLFRIPSKLYASKKSIGLSLSCFVDPMVRTWSIDVYIYVVYGTYTPITSICYTCRWVGSEGLGTEGCSDIIPIANLAIFTDDDRQQAREYLDRNGACFECVSTQHQRIQGYLIPVDIL